MPGLVPAMTEKEASDQRPNRKMAPRGTSRRHRFCTCGDTRWLELHGHAAIDGRFGAGVGALAGCCDGADAGHCVVIEAELVLPVAVGNPEVDEVRVLRTDE